jgi:cardiolipin synthase
MTFFILSIVSIAIVALLLLLILVEPGLPYRVRPPRMSVDSDGFLCLLGAMADARVNRYSTMEVHTNGPDFYEAQLRAIRNAQLSVHIEAFIFHRSAIGDRFLDALIERAKAGVKVKMVIDAIGSLLTPNGYFSALRQAGGRVEWYQPIRWYLLKRLNNRTHRELMIIDGQIGFIGGAGIASHWIDGDKPSLLRPMGPPWRDTVCQLSGDLVTGLQSTFAENWLESSGNVLSGEDCFPICKCGVAHIGDVSQPSGLVIMSTPSAARSTRARMVFQILLACARKSIHINSPYFVPDRSAVGELVRAVGRGVEVTIVTPGKFNNHPITRILSRRRYGKLLAAGARIFEYQPGMIHRKIMIIDGLWAVVGSTNFDNRSFGLNDEVNLVAVDPHLARRLEADFENDLSQSSRVLFEQWRRRPLSERVLAMLFRPFERQN